MFTWGMLRGKNTETPIVQTVRKKLFLETIMLYRLISMVKSVLTVDRRLK